MPATLLLTLDSLALKRRRRSLSRAHGSIRSACIHTCSYASVIEEDTRHDGEAEPTSSDPNAQEYFQGAVQRAALDKPESADESYMRLP